LDFLLNQFKNINGISEFERLPKEVQQRETVVTCAMNVFTALMVYLGVLVGTQSKSPVVQVAQSLFTDTNSKSTALLKDTINKLNDAVTQLSVAIGVKIYEVLQGFHHS
jgi:hypothetical protein